jgi:hypothetical protein
MKMNKKINSSKIWKTTLAVALVLSLSIFALAGCSSGGKSNQAANSGTNTNSSQGAVGNSSTDTDGDGIPDSVEKTYGTNPYVADTDGDGVNDKEDKSPVTTENLIKEINTAPLEVTIKDARVEDNATEDHLEITMTNTGKTALSEFDIFYTITDKGNNAQESYYQVLSGLSLNAGETKTIHFDNQVKEAGHYYGNMNGLYGTSANGLTFDIQLHAKGYQPMKLQVEKATGTAEVAD